jgi:hypothetical protein
MPFIKLRRNWFGPDGIRYKARDGMIQVTDEVAAQAPTTAEIFDDKGKQLPSRAPVPRPGYGAKPIEEQRLDIIPGAAPTHLINVAPDDAEVGALDDDDRKAVKAARDARAKLAQEQAKTPEHKDEQKAIDKNVTVAAQQEVKDKQATDPVAVASGQVPTPKK